MSKIQAIIIETIFSYYLKCDLYLVECEARKRRVYLATSLGDGKKSND